MPLHLLGKKSWNVYNSENIARVRRDEAQAKAQEEEEERRMQEVDAERRIQILRGERPSSPPPPPPPQSSVSSTDKHRYSEEAGRHRKRRRLAGENDTDRDIRFAQEDAKMARATQDRQARVRSSDAPLHDSTGHIDLFPSETARKPAEKNAEAEKESTERQRRFEDQYTMRFSNAAGFRQSVGQNPWYSSSRTDTQTSEAMPSKDVWGNEDPLRKEREKARMDANDPLAAMRIGVQQLRSVERQRNRWNEERKRELEEIKSVEKRRSRHRRKRSASQDSLEGFRLDASPDSSRKSHDPSSRRHHRRDRSRDRSHHRHSHSKSDSHHRRHDRHRGTESRNRATHAE
ncbi:uncharacterized protein BO97DRAFT_167225 [Aspergillus homomorphus CBS 101889]|uniref:CBF1-interacting co-repressor CIR N-terminal domain-containing protein n=1 Tax=Aspergillus homomorphus (strain CBS 101889) TaxID=1450537 RepID=A0A395HNN3_ASPHC|nr:hypothetical protein BO97DRAFT_167225 [Aspergillus homomorphus CBS 101889]RAL09562.1 hypothetical protein BO97DRAFT_167225 [Aspergillus homomorphus CBS 101889]